MDMTFGFALIGITAGFLAHVLLKGGRLGVLGDVAVGVLGAVLGGYLLRLAHVSTGGLWNSLLLASAGAALLIFDLRLLQKTYSDQRRPLSFFSRSASTVQRSLKGTVQPALLCTTCRTCGQKQSESSPFPLASASGPAAPSFPPHRVTD
jgi:uncharacterized membrane protein YeaQ/YmgE (transglycosylase-associated protein family)